MKEGYKKTELGWIPNEWEINKLSSISEIIMGQSPDSNSYNDEKIGIPFFQGKTEFGRINPIVKKWCSNPIKISQPQDVLISVRAPVGEVNINIEESCIGRGLAAIRQKNCDYKFLFYYMQKIKNRLNLSAQGSTFTAINSGDLKNISIITPPLEEQQKIADILSTVDAQIDDTDKLIEKTKELKKGLMQRLLTKGIGHSEFKKSEVGEIPVEWEIKSLGQLFKLSSGEGLSQKDIVNGEYPVYGGNGISGHHNQYLFEDSKIVIGRVGAKCGCIHKSLKNSWITDNALYIKEKKVNYNDNYMVYLLEFLDLNRFANKNAQPVISGQKIYLINIGFPNLNEQNKIADILISVDNQISEYENKKLKLEELKKGLMQQLLTGKIRVV